MYFGRADWHTWQEEGSSIEGRDEGGDDAEEAAAGGLTALVCVSVERGAEDEVGISVSQSESEEEAYPARPSI